MYKKETQEINNNFVKAIVIKLLVIKLCRKQIMQHITTQWHHDNKQRITQQTKHSTTQRQISKQNTRTHSNLTSLLTFERPYFLFVWKLNPQT